jgi:glucose dehydrogenase
VPAWSFSFGGEKQRGQESQPLIYNGKMFVTASYSRIFADRLKTGNKLWKYEHRLPDGIMPCCDVVNRGAALFGNLVIFGTLDAQLVALNQNTGKVVWKEKVDDYAAGYSMTAAPLIAKGVLIYRRVGRRIRRGRPGGGAQSDDGRAVWSRPTVEGHMGYRYDKDGKDRERHHRHRQQELAGRPVEDRRRLHLDGRHLRPAPASPISAPATRRPGTATCVPATTCIRRPRWRWTRNRPDQVGLPEHAQ